MILGRIEARVAFDTNAPGTFRLRSRRSVTRFAPIDQPQSQGGGAHLPYLDRALRPRSALVLAERNHAISISWSEFSSQKAANFCGIRRSVHSPSPICLAWAHRRSLNLDEGRVARAIWPVMFPTNLKGGWSGYQAGFIEQISALAILRRMDPALHNAYGAMHLELRDTEPCLLTTGFFNGAQA